MFFFKGEAVRFRVTGESFIETSPITGNDADKKSTEQTSAEVPYSITVSNKQNILFSSFSILIKKGQENILTVDC